MEHNLAEQFKRLSKSELKDNLESLCVSAQESVILRELSPEEKIKLQQEWVSGAIDIAIKKDNFDTIKQEYKTELQPLELRNKEILGSLRSNSIEEEGMVYEIPNQESGNMEKFDSSGNLLQMRPLMPEERQRSLIHDSVMKTEKVG